jgi:hypothetical protein
MHPEILQRVVHGITKLCLQAGRGDTKEWKYKKEYGLQKMYPVLLNL